MKKIFDWLNERDKNFSSEQFEYEDECIEDSNEADMSTQFLLKAYHSPEKHSVNCLLSNKAKEPYKDHLCLFCALAMYMNGHSDLDAHTSRYFTEFKTKSGYDPKNFRGALVVDLPDVDESVQRNIFIFDFDIQEGDYIGELARRILEDLIKQFNY